MAKRGTGQPSKHTIPAIDRMMDVLSELERHASGRTIRVLTDALPFPRTTIYRILNTLQHHEVVRRNDDGSYQLGRRLLALAAHTATRYSQGNLTAVCQPHLERLAAEIGEGIKLSILDDDGVIVLAAAQGHRDYALTVAAGQRMPVHASAAGKLLLAYLAKDELDFWLSRPLPAYTAKTITDPKRLRTELSTIRRSQIAYDKGESAPSILAVATPVFAKQGQLLAAISVPFLVGTAAGQTEKIKLAAIRAAVAISDEIPD